MTTVKITIESASGTKTRTVRNATPAHITHLRTWARDNTPVGGTATFSTN